MKQKNVKLKCNHFILCTAYAFTIMDRHTSINLSHIPKIGLSYGSEEYHSTGYRDLAVGDEVVWTLSNDTRFLIERPLIGNVEFVGERVKPSSNSNGGTPVVAAVVQFVRNQPTCHLPGHLTNPPSNRNLISASQLTRKGNGHWELSTEHNNNSMPFMKMSIQLIGNCFVLHHGIDVTNLEEFREGDHIAVRTENIPVAGKVMVSGNVKGYIRDGYISCVGVKFEQSLDVCAPAIEISHYNVRGNECPRCVGGTLAFIPMKILSYTKGKENSLPVQRSLSKLTIRPKTDNSRKAKGSSKPTVKSRNESSTPASSKSTCIFIGNCVAVKNGIETTPVKGIKKGDIITAYKDISNAIAGNAMVTCTFNNLETSYYSYVGVRFDDSFGGTCANHDSILHCGLEGRHPSTCKICEGGKLVFIPVDIFHLKAPTAGITLQVLSN